MSTKAVNRNLKFLLAASALLCAASAFAQQVFRVYRGIETAALSAGLL